MSILTKTIGKKKYAYLAYRSGKKVVHKYLGPVSNPDVVSKIEELRSEKKIPKKLTAFFWDTNPEKIDLKANSRYVIERIMESGNMDAFEWIQRIYPANL